MLAKRIIPCLDVDAGRVVKGIRFVSLVDAGDPVEQGKRYDLEGADELTFLDITASSDKRAIVAELVRRVADARAGRRQGLPGAHGRRLRITEPPRDR